MPRPTKALECPSPPSCAPGTILVETARLVLRRFQPSDAPLARAANHRAVWDGVRDSFPHPYTLADAETFVTPSPDPTQRGLPNPAKVAVCVKILPADDDHGSQAQQLVGCIGADPGQDVLGAGLLAHARHLGPRLRDRGDGRPAALVAADVAWLTSRAGPHLCWQSAERQGAGQVRLRARGRSARGGGEGWYAAGLAPICCATAGRQSSRRNHKNIHIINCMHAIQPEARKT
ncbi:acetyltransferase [Akanthomyces lecanii RCEF 1005]|uniref:Acetyltransferase n=1 Tax=Akanthomyces lecanii RCEF 1005 TaxID=1081108 RepID=A0A168JW80_CORDF|nr:acetyltransferase [Akanthomyces lecanii RCEF 1005]